MIEEKLDELYTELAQNVVDMIPMDWKDINFFATISKEEGMKAYFGVFYFTDEEGKIWRSLDMEEELGMPEEEFDECLRLIRNVVYKIYTLFEDNDQELWKAIAFKLDEIGKFKVDFLYDEEYLGKWYDEGAWAYEYFGYKPKSGRERLHIDKYLEDKANGFKGEK